MTREEMIDASVRAAIHPDNLWAMSQTASDPYLVCGTGRLWQAYWHHEIKQVRAHFTRIAAREGVR